MLDGVGRYAVVISLWLWGVYAMAVEGPDTIQLEMSNVARARAIDTLKGQYRHQHDPIWPRIEELEATAAQDAGRQEAAVEIGLHAGGGSHTVQVLVGGQPRELIIDTGSGKTAFVCEGCHECGNNRKHDPFYLTPNTTFSSCDLSMTTDIDDGESPCMVCENDKCKYGQTYVEGDYWNAYKASDVMQLSSTFAARVEFGCIYEQSGVFTEQTSDGIMGFSRHHDAIFEQLYRSKVTQSRIFAQCLTEGGGLLTLGGVDLARHSEPVQYTPLRNTGYQYWTVHLQAVSVGAPTNTLAIDSREYNADRGCVLDSGTTFLYMPEGTNGPFRDAWLRAVGDLLYVPQSGTFYSLKREQVESFPDVCFWFKHDAHICVPPSRYFAKIGNGVYTGTIFFTAGPKATILGASVLEGHDVIYDVDNHRVGVAEASCDQPLQAAIQLSLDPGGDKFHADIDLSQASQWMLAGITLLATAGLINAIWVAATTKRDAPARSSSQPKDNTLTDWQSDDFAFFLMPEDE